MTLHPQTQIVHDEMPEPCYACRGKGTTTEKTERGTYLTDDCDRCNGTGYKVILVIGVNQ